MGYNTKVKVNTNIKVKTGKKCKGWRIKIRERYDKHRED